MAFRLPGGPERIVGRPWQGAGMSPGTKATTPIARFGGGLCVDATLVDGVADPALARFWAAATGCEYVRSSDSRPGPR